jgi:hypothetical protein
VVRRAVERRAVVLRPVPVRRAVVRRAVPALRAVEARRVPPERAVVARRVVPPDLRAVVRRAVVRRAVVLRPVVEARRVEPAFRRVPPPPDTAFSASLASLRALFNQEALPRRKFAGSFLICFSMLSSVEP